MILERKSSKMYNSNWIILFLWSCFWHFLYNSNWNILWHNYQPEFCSKMAGNTQKRARTDASPQKLLDFLV